MKALSKSVRSMTGFARVRKAVSGGELVISIKSVNHRGLDIRFHNGADLEPYENALRTLLGRRMVRGHVDVRVSFVRMSGAENVGLNRPLMKAYITAFKEACSEHGIESEPDLNNAFRLPGMLTESMESEPSADFEKDLISAVDEALDILDAFRTREGGQLAEEIQPRIENTGKSVQRMEAIRSKAQALFHQRLNERLAELLKTVSIEPQRLIQEAALLAERSDIGEELARLRIHASQLSEILEAGGELGKRMDFLLQEMHREANTVLSKTIGIGELGVEITDLALAVKADIEKIREQVMNLE